MNDFPGPTRFLVGACAMLLVGGCAHVDVRRDYEVVQRHVADTTGQARSYQPGQDDESAVVVGNLLSDGLTADEAVQITLLNNPELQSAYMNVGMARADVVQSGLFSNPSLALSLRFPEGGGLANLDASLAQNIADLWLIPSRKQAAQASLNQAILELARRANLAAVQARAAFYRALSAERILEIATENRQIAQELLDAALARRDAGAGSDVDVNLSRSDVMDTELAVRVARLAAFEERSALALSLGLGDPPDNLHLAGTLPDLPVGPFTAEELVALAESHRLDVQAAAQAERAAYARIVQEYRKVFPELAIGPSVERNERRALPGRNILADTARASVANGALTAPDIESRGQRNQERRQQIDAITGAAIGMTLPVFDQNQAQIAKARFAWQQAEKLYQSVALTAKQETRAAFERARTRWDVTGFYRDSIVPLREANLKLSREAYSAGRLSFLAVLEAQRSLLEARSNYVDALRDYAVVLTDLERATGKPMITIVVAPPEQKKDGG